MSVSIQKSTRKILENDKMCWWYQRVISINKTIAWILTSIHTYTCTNCWHGWWCISVHSRACMFCAYWKFNQCHLTQPLPLRHLRYAHAPNAPRMSRFRSQLTQLSTFARDIYASVNRQLSSAWLAMFVEFPRIPLEFSRKRSKRLRDSIVSQ